MGDGSAELGELLEDTDVPGVADEVVGRIEAERLRRALRNLPETERRILVLRHGLDGGRACTLVETARLVGCSREWVRQLQRRAEGSVRRMLEKGV